MLVSLSMVHRSPLSSPTIPCWIHSLHSMSPFGRCIRPIHVVRWFLFSTPTALDRMFIGSLRLFLLLVSYRPTSLLFLRLWFASSLVVLPLDGGHALHMDGAWMWIHWFRPFHVCTSSPHPHHVHLLGSSCFVFPCIFLSFLGFGSNTCLTTTNSNDDNNNNKKQNEQQ